VFTKRVCVNDAAFAVARARRVASRAREHDDDDDTDARRVARGVGGRGDGHTEGMCRSVR
jgi:hypothetical protein